MTTTKEDGIGDVGPPEDQQRPSRLYSPSGGPRSVSFFSSFSAFASRTTSTNGPSEVHEQSAPTKGVRKISERFSQTPFFNQRQRRTTTPFFKKQRREPSVQIKQRGLMAPLGPPLPRSSTVGNLGQIQDSPSTPRFMRSTSSSTARRSSLATPKKRGARLPSIEGSKIPTSTRRVSSHRQDESSRAPTSQISKLTTVPPTPINTAMPSSGTTAPENTPSSLAYANIRDYSLGPEYEHSIAESTHSTRRSSFIPAPIQSRLSLKQGKPVGKKLTLPPSPPASLRGNNNTQVNPSHNTQMTRSHNTQVTQSTITLFGWGMSHQNETASTNTSIGLTEDNTSGNTDTNIEHSGQSKPSGSDADSPITAIHDPAESMASSNGRTDDSKPFSGPERPHAQADNAEPVFGPERPPVVRESSPDMSDPRLVHTALHNLEWAGRYSSLSDRFRNQALNSHPPHGPNPTPFDLSLTSSTAEHPMNDDAGRNLRIWDHLYKLCMTDEARGSLAVFKKFMDEREQAMIRGGVKGSKVKEKHRFLHSLMGKKK